MSGPALLELQRGMQASILAQQDAGAICSQVATPRGIGARQRVGVYVDAYRLRLLEILADDYSVLATWLGEDVFAKVGNAYIAAHPSTTRSVRWFGRHLGSFLEHHAPDQPLAAELAHFEWMQGLAFDAADAEPVTMAAMASVAAGHWPTLTFRLHPSVKRIALRYNVPSLFAALVAANEPRPEAEVARQPITWMLWRRDLNVRWRQLVPEESSCLEAVAEEADFSSLCEVWCDQMESDEAAAPVHVAGMLKRWLDDGIIAGLHDPQADAD